jgi:hypothetical protein
LKTGPVRQGSEIFAIPFLCNIGIPATRLASSISDTRNFNLGSIGTIP